MIIRNGLSSKTHSTRGLRFQKPWYVVTHEITDRVNSSLNGRRGMAEPHRVFITRMRKHSRQKRGLLIAIGSALSLLAHGALAESFSLLQAIRLANENAPTVSASTLLSFAYRESRLRPFAIHDNTAGQSDFPASAALAAELASALLAHGHNLDLGIMQINSVNLARTGLTITTAFNPAESMRAGGMILVAAYQQCLRGNPNPNDARQQAALRCAASVYNTGNDQAGIVNGYQAGVWRAAAQIVPAIQLSTFGTLPSPPATLNDVVAPEPRGPPPGLEDALHATPPVQERNDALSDALHLAKGKDTP
jgi:type IV secretion system protein VirB1